MKWVFNLTQDECYNRRKRYCTCRQWPFSVLPEYGRISTYRVYVHQLHYSATVHVMTTNILFMKNERLWSTVRKEENETFKNDFLRSNPRSMITKSILDRACPLYMDQYHARFFQRNLTWHGYLNSLSEGFE